MLPLNELEIRIGYKFKDRTLLETAMRHSSYINEHKMNRRDCNERIEFLGDSVLELVSSEFLFEKLPDMPEGDLTRIRAALVCEAALYNDAKEIELGEFLSMGKGEDKTGGRMRPSIVSDAMEALIGAVYMDSGLEKAREFIYRFILSDYEEKLAIHDAKTALQEMVQSVPDNILEYEITNETGPEHKKKFTAAVLVNGKIVCTGTGKSKKEAEQNAATVAINIFKEM